MRPVAKVFISWHRSHQENSPREGGRCQDGEPGVESAHSRRKISRCREFPFTLLFSHDGNNEMRRYVECRPMMASIAGNTVEIVADRELGS